jgi:light-harvesting complex I chlorophyll a/b binding protein 1
MALSMKTMQAARIGGFAPKVQRPSVAARAADTGAPAPVNEDTVAYLKTLPGISQPFPDMFDPLNLARTASIKDVRRWRESEITHGRVAMLAALGFIVGEQLEDFPAFVNFDGHITGPAINQFQQVRQGFWEPLLIAIGLCESYRVSLGWATPQGQGFNALKDEYEMGNLGFDPLGLKPTDPAALKDMQTKELNNGRLAMIAIAAFTAQELVSHQEIFEHLALRFEKEAILELDDVERDLNLPVTPVPSLVLEELAQ